MAEHPEHDNPEPVRQALDKAICRGQLSELHTHLMGMGSAEFWQRIITIYLTGAVDTATAWRNRLKISLRRIFKKPKADAIADECMDALKAASRSNSEQSKFSDEKIIVDKTLRDRLALLKEEEYDTFLEDTFTTDIVFPENDLYRLCEINSNDIEGNDDDRLQLRRYRLEGQFNNSANAEQGGKPIFRECVYLNARRRALCWAVGLRNADLAELIRSSENVKAMVKGWFQFLGRDGCTAHHQELIQVFRGQFTPKFYPMKFLARDCICQQLPVVLGILMNTIVGRYNRAGVSYVEFSISANDLKNPIIVNAIVTESFHSPLTKSISKSKEQKVNAQSPEDPTRKRKKTKLIIDAKETFGVSPQQKDAFPRLTTKAYSSDRKPHWREHFGDYFKKPKDLQVTFLMAFNRNSAKVKFPFKYGPEKFEYKELEVNGSALKLMTQFVASIQENVPLQEVADRLCSNSNIEIMFKENIASAKEILENLKNVNFDQDLRDFWRQLLVGLDVVGDEIGAPCIPLTHPAFLDIVKYFREHGRRRFGVRVHAGESVIRAPSRNFPQPFLSNRTVPSLLDRVFELHIRVLVTAIRKLHDEIGKSHDEPSMVRIGHGVAFLLEAEHDGDDSMFDSTPASDDDVKTLLKKFRKFCRENRIVFELNPTSNDVLLADTLGESPQNQRTLRRFLENKLSVTLCTDDDGIWALQKCNRHHSHISVAHEYCAAIEHGEIRTVAQLESMIDNGRRAAFIEVLDNNSTHSVVG